MQVQILGRFTTCADRVAKLHPYAATEPLWEGELSKNDFGTRVEHLTQFSPGGRVLSFDTEVSVVGGTVFTYNGGVHGQSFTAQTQSGKGGAYETQTDELRPIATPFYARFRVEESVVTDAPSRACQLRRALTVLYPRSITLYFDNGVTEQVPIPYQLEAAWPLREGILIRRKDGRGEDATGSALYTLRSALDYPRPVSVGKRVKPPHGGVSASSAVVNGASHATEAFGRILKVSVAEDAPQMIVAFNDGNRKHSIWMCSDSVGKVDAEPPVADIALPMRRALEPDFGLSLLWEESEPGSLGLKDAAETTSVSPINAHSAVICFLGLAHDGEEYSSAQGRRRLVALQCSLSVGTSDNRAAWEILWSLPALGAVQLRCVRSKAFDVLILNPDHTLKLWTGNQGFVACKIPTDFPSVLSGHLTGPGKRPRSPDDTDPGKTDSMEDISVPEAEPGFRTSRIVQLSSAADNRFNLELSNGTTYRATLEPNFRSSVVRRCVEALRHALPVDLFDAFQQRLFTSQHGTALEPTTEGDYEWQTLVGVLCSFCRQRFPSDRKEAQSPKRQRPDSLTTLLNRSKRKRRWIAKLVEQASHLLAEEDDVSQDTCVPSCPSPTSRFDQLAQHPNGPSLTPHLPTILLFLHVVYEDLKLNILTAKHASRLAHVLLHIAKSLEWSDYVYYYGQEQPEESLVDLYFDPLLQPCPIPPIDFLSWTLQKTRSNMENTSALDALIELMRNKDSEATTFLRSTRVYTISRLYTELHSNGAVGLVQGMLEHSIDRNALATLTTGIGLPLQQAIDDCREDPPGDWSVDAYLLIGREDLATQVEQLSKPLSADFSMSEELPEDTSSKADAPFDGTESAQTEVCKLRFNKDRRVDEVRKLLQSSRPILAKMELDFNATEEKQRADQQKYLMGISTRILARPLGRAPFTIGTVTPVATNVCPIPDLVVSARFAPMTTEVPLDVSKSTQSPLSWPDFHNGVAAGLSIAPHHEVVDGAWIVFNTPLATEDGKRHLSCRHAGFLLGLGLAGNLKKMNLFDLIDYMNLKDEYTAVALLLGLAATHKGDRDLRHTRICYSHIEAAEDMAGKPTGVEVKAAAVLGIGLLHMGSMARLHCEKMMYLLETIENEPSDFPEPHRENCALACGFALGFITVGGVSSSKAAGISDLKLVDRLLHYALGRSKHYIITSATLALGLMQLKTNDTMIADRLALPKTSYFLNQIKPDVLLMRTLCRSIILWDSIKATEEWLLQQVPEYIRRGTQESADDEDWVDLYSQAQWNILAGAGFAIGLKYAGSSNESAFQTLLSYCRKLADMSSTGGSMFRDKLNRGIFRNCLDVMLLSLCVVMAGSANVEILRLLRRLHNRTASEVTYGNHTATNMAIGFLFLGAGSYTFGTSNEAIAALLCALFPQSSSQTTHNRGHIHAARQLWALAVERRCFITRDVGTMGKCCPPVVVTVADGVATREIKMSTPCLLPAYDSIVKITTSSPRYWGRVLEVAHNQRHAEILKSGRGLYVKRKMRYLNHIQDEADSEEPTSRSLDLSSTHPHVPESSVTVPISLAPEIAGFATYLCPENTTSDPTHVLLQRCIEFESPDAVTPLMWIDVTTRDRGNFSRSAVLALKIILESYQSRQTASGSSRDTTSDGLRQRQLLPASFIKRLRSELEAHFRAFERDENNGENIVDNPWKLSLFRYLDSDVEKRAVFAPEARAAFSAYLAYREWPTASELEWIRKSVARTSAAAGPKVPTTILELGVLSKFPRMPRRTLEWVLAYCHYTREREH
ncbi:uncharacterized protein EV422DRAFT_309840 [Fimicolochytrium jonesii]|uniref:uncharacterized protein n=1 Tax=Fimicolochytrium jonesii TaxID=1396493 RepID=UPI0022FE5B0F|nr:uncharacterized protein EV422DRAFT_309840 [Fimicolochytrium jonesii]KAI8824175.1 hypothetical protein EV422DRAFT_309840 [Fimicolochytrium jonesii]